MFTTTTFLTFFHLENFAKLEHEIMICHLSIRNGGDTEEQLAKKEDHLKAQAEQSMKDFDMDPENNYVFNIVPHQIGNQKSIEIANIVIKEIESYQADMIVIGCRGHLKLKHYLGSVSDHVIKNTKAAAFIMKN